MALADRVDEIVRGLPRGWERARLELTVEEPEDADRASLLLASATPGRSGGAFTLYVHHGASELFPTVGLVKRVVARLGVPPPPGDGSVAHLLVQFVLLPAYLAPDSRLLAPGSRPPLPNTCTLIPSKIRIRRSKSTTIFGHPPVGSFCHDCSPGSHALSSRANPEEYRSTTAQRTRWRTCDSILDTCQSLAGPTSNCPPPPVTPLPSAAVGFPDSRLPAPRSQHPALPPSACILASSAASVANPDPCILHPDPSPHHPASAL